MKYLGSLLLIAVATSNVCRAQDFPDEPQDFSIYENEVPTGPKEIVKGWLPEYSQHIENKIQQYYGDLLTLPAGRVTRLCPKWANLETTQRIHFWSAMIAALAFEESGFDRTQIYRETTLRRDATTGYQTHSEGLLQISYHDVVNYSYAGGDVSWPKDRQMAIVDYQNGRKSGNPRRTILSAYPNLNLSLKMMHTLVMRRHSNLRIEQSMGQYWSPMRNKLGRIQRSLSKSMPACTR